MDTHANDPILDFRSLFGDGQTRKEALKLLDNAFQTHGFVYLSNHSIPQRLIDESFEWTKRFFDLPLQTKALVRRSTNPYDDRGFIPIGAAVVNQEEEPQDVQELGKARSNAAVEQRETFDLGNPYARDELPNRLLPEDMLPGFSTWLEKWWNACMALQLKLTTCLCAILAAERIQSSGADLEVLAKQQTSTRSRSNMSLIHYLPVSLNDLQDRKSSRCNAHTDSGQLTLLFQNGVGGLEVHDKGVNGRKKGFSPVPPRPGTIIVQLGDMLEKQSNGRWRSALHRVTAPLPDKTPDQVGGRERASSSSWQRVFPDRYSIAFFVYPDHETVIAPLPGCEKKGPWNSLNWGNVRTAGDWWRLRKHLEFGSADDKA